MLNLKKTLTLIIFLFMFGLNAQSLTIEEIKVQTNLIDNKSSLKNWSSEWYNVEDKNDSIVYWCFLDIWYENNQIYKITEFSNRSFGNEKITIYLKNGKPIKIIESENNNLKDSSDQVFEDKLYFTEWDKNEYVVENKGKRVYSIENYTKDKYNSILKSANSDLVFAIKQENLMKNLK